MRRPRRNESSKRRRAARLTLLGTVIISLALALPAVTLAQDEDPGAGSSVVNEALGVTVFAPTGWEKAETQGNEKSIANFRHPESQSQIEVIGTKLYNEDVAQVFFDTFHESLVSTDFTETSAATESTIGDIEGRRSEYSFEHTGIRLRVVVFSFLREESAWLVIGYFKEEERDTYLPALEKVVESLQFS